MNRSAIVSRGRVSRRSLLGAATAAACGLLAPGVAAPASASGGGPWGQASGDSPHLRTISEWEQAVLAFWNDPDAFGDEHYRARSLSGDSYRQYWLGYGVEAATELAQATGKTEWLSYGLEYGLNLVDTAVLSSTLPGSQWKDGFLGWPSGRSAYLGMELPLDEGICWRSITRMLRVVRDTPAWHGDPEIRAKYDQLLEFAEINVFGKWYHRGLQTSPPLTSMYQNRTHSASHWAFIGLNLSQLTDSEERKSHYDEIRRNIDLGPMPVRGSSLHDQLIANPNNPEAYFWNPVWGSHATPGSDIFHGSHVVDYILEAHDRGVSWSAEDVRKLVVLFDQVVWPSNNQSAKYVDGSGLHEPVTLGGWAGFLKLGRHDAALQARLDTVVAMADQLRKTDLAAPAYAFRALNAKRLGVRYGFSADEVVEFGGVSSGVRNAARPDGWTIQDLVQAQAPFGDHGEFVRTVGAVAGDFCGRGLIDQREKSAIVASAAKSEIGRSGR